MDYKRDTIALIVILTLLLSTACTSTAKALTPGPPTATASVPQVTPVVVTVEPTPLPDVTSTPALTLAAPATPVPPRSPIATPDALITYPWINLRTGPGSWYDLLAELDQGTHVAVLAQYGDCAWLYVRTTDGMIGWVIANDEYLDLNIPCEALPSGWHRPPTSVVRSNTRSGGAGELQIYNETAEDCLVVLGLGDFPVYAAYIRSHETFFMSGIQDGHYTLFFAHGADWNGEAFMRDVSYRRFTSTLDFVSDAETYTQWTVTLYGVGGGGTPETEEVAVDTFPTW